MLCWRKRHRTWVMLLKALEIHLGPAGRSTGGKEGDAARADTGIQYHNCLFVRTHVSRPSVLMPWPVVRVTELKLVFTALGRSLTRCSGCQYEL